MLNKNKLLFRSGRAQSKQFNKATFSCIQWHILNLHELYDISNIKGKGQDEFYIMDPKIIFRLNAEIFKYPM